MPLFTLEPWQLAVLLAPALLNTWGIWHVFKHSFATQTERAIWLVVCVLIPLLGGLIYLIFGFRRATGKAGPLFVSPSASVKSQSDASTSGTLDPEQKAKAERQEAAE